MAVARVTDTASMERTIRYCQRCQRPTEHRRERIRASGWRWALANLFAMPVPVRNTPWRCQVCQAEGRKPGE